MELRVSARRPRRPYGSDRDDKEISDDDDDRNHKHRRRDDARFQSLEDEVTKPYKRGSKPYQNGHICVGTGSSQSNETWRKYSFNPLEKEISVKFDQKVRGSTLFSRGPSDLNQKNMVNQSFSQMVHQGSIRGSNSDGRSWSSFGLVPGIPNGGVDRFHPLGLQGTYRPGISSSLNMGLLRQQCRDFEEQGFCLRGDMCPMEHGMNRIVVEDVQSLSQFNLPISRASAGPTPATSVVTNTLPNNKAPHDVDIDSAADFYDPDQPLWSHDSHTSTAVQNDPLLDHGLSDGSDNELVTSGGAVASLKTKSSIQGRIISLKKRTETGGPSNFLHNGRTNHKPSQKAQRTLFVNGIPVQSNKRELLLSHFKKFGEVTNISIPLNGERAFVQFSKREEAEAALMAPDAVMSNRFIKLWWANRDIMSVPIPPHGFKVSAVNSVASKRKDDFQPVLHNSKVSCAPVSASDHSKPMVVDGTKVTPPLQKKLESLELLKEELRKKQEMLDQKRNDFRLKLDKLEKQATGPKGEVAREQLAKKQKSGVLVDSVKAATPSGGDCEAVVPSAQDKVAVAGTSSKSVGPSGKQGSKTNLVLALPESSSLKASELSLVNLGSPVGSNRFKLDNRPTAFKVVPPLPDGLADVSVLKEHFSPYSDLSSVQVDDPKTSNVAAQIHFRTRHAAEKAFLGGRTWKGHNLQFVWLNPSNSRKDDVVRQTLSPLSKDSPKNTSQQPYTSGDGDSEKTEGTENVKNDTVSFASHQSNCISGRE